jgi:hypothetical protein
MKSFALFALTLLISSAGFAGKHKCSIVHGIGEGAGHYTITDSLNSFTATIEFYGSEGSAKLLSTRARSVLNGSGGVYYFKELGESRFIIISSNGDFNGGYALLGGIPSKHSKLPLNQATVERYGVKIANLDCR